MDILGIGPMELVFIVLLALIILGPKDMQKAGRTIGRWLRDLVQSEGWRAFRDTSREIRNLPNRLMREANLEELEKTNQEIKEAIDMRKQGYGTWGNPGTGQKPPQSRPVTGVTDEKRIAPPSEPAPAPTGENEENKDKNTDA